MSTRLVPEVTKALKAAKNGSQDVGAAALALRYAELIDEAQALADEVAELEFDPRDVDSRQRLARLEKLVAGHAATSDLGPKLLAVLTALGATPAGRKDAKSGMGGNGNVSNLPSPLAALRDSARTRNAAALPGATA